MKTMSNHAKLVPVQITNRDAITLIKERARLEKRSAANAASITIIESLGKKPQGDNPPGPDFLAKVHCKDTGGEPGSQEARK
jgi:hypothetical protein